MRAPIGPDRRSRSRMEVTVARMSLFNSPLMLGFDQIERSLDRMTKAAPDGYPPYNIERLGPDRLQIVLAVAGFTLEDLHIEIEANQLTVAGSQSDEDDGRVFRHRPPGDDLHRVRQALVHSKSLALPVY